MKRIWFVVLVTVIAGTFLGGAWYWHRLSRPEAFLPDRSENQSGSPNSGLEDEREALANNLNILLLGRDTRPEEDSLRTDTIILVSLIPEQERIALLSIPRDTRVSVPGKGYVKINALPQLGGIELLRDVLSDLLGIPIHNYVLTDFKGFMQAIDMLGGVTIDVEQDMYYRTGDMVINLKKGRQHLNGEQALQYVRYRNYTLGDITRTQRQQKLLKAFANEVMQVGTIRKLPQLLPQLWKTVETDLSWRQVLAILSWARDWDSKQIISHTLPGSFQAGTTYWIVDKGKAREVTRKILQGVVEGPVVLGSVGGSGEKLEPSRENQLKTDISSSTPDTEIPVTVIQETYEGEPEVELSSDTVQEAREEAKSVVGEVYQPRDESDLPLKEQILMTNSDNHEETVQSDVYLSF
ncbi:LCP family protein [Calderihabitans maritimus]|uniref:Transcriptional regulator n=1 Tax=Calderihabitans maritimus TaxID=1246530 RepID=A0A1Z5HPP3_9FIRM|nr:LCP family protein [Calderihabitans maritimus]GAW91506.1 transcriptional regulator [Calderihabitans maritimus]